METSFRIAQAQKPKQALSPQMRQGVRLLALNLADLRSEVLREMAANPVLEDVETPGVLRGGAIEEMEKSRSDEARDADWPDDENTLAESLCQGDPEAADRHQSFLESRTRPETLIEHLRAQIGLLDLDAEGEELAITLLGYFDGDGRFSGPIPDIVMVTGASEARIREVLKAISTLDPPGCGATNLAECLLAQLERVSARARDEVRAIIERHLADVAAQDWAKIENALGISRERLMDDIAQLRTLEPHPARAFTPQDADEAYINPEVRAVKRAGRWIAEVEQWGIPRLRISSVYVAMANSSSTPKETREYIKSRLASAEDIASAIENRTETIRSVAQAIFDAQPGFFVSGIKGLVPLTMEDIAKATNLHRSTISRTVNGKYASTPHGVVELRSFFIAGLANAQGEEVAKSEVFARLKEIVAGEDAAHPLSDEKIAAALAASGFALARRTVAKYRGKLGMPGAEERAKGARA